MQKRVFTGAVLFLALFAQLTLAAEKAQPYYLAPVQVDLVHILAPPPKLGTNADTADFNAVLTAQNERSPEQIKSAQADAEFTVFRFADVLGPDFKTENLPFTTEFFKRVLSDENLAVAAAKAYFNRPRPFVSHAEIKPVVEQPPNASYPSGHSTFAYVHAILLADIAPEKAAALFARADAFAHNRVIAGVHYPTDIEAGRISAAVIDNLFLHDPRFLADLDKVRAEMRAALHLDQ